VDQYAGRVREPRDSVEHLVVRKKAAVAPVVGDPNG
jgi:hypothetical protein